MRAAASLLVMAACATVVACEPGSAGAARVSLPAGASRALATVTLYTSPDGGIYENPDHTEVRLVLRHAPGDVEAMLPGNGWKPLDALGDFTFVGVSIRNDGKAGSDPQLNAVQIASDYAPDGTATGPLRHFYHPLFPLAVLSPGGSDSSCTVHVDPGQTVVVVLVYPPLRATATIVWGVYHSFAVRAPFGGALPPGSYAWRATACVPPQPPAS